MIKTVVDTNVLVSGLLNSTGAPAKLILRWLKGQFDLVISEPTMQEHEYVFRHLPEVDQDKAAELLEQLRSSAIRVTIPNELRACKHFPAKAYESVRIVTVSKFLTVLEKQIFE